MNRGLGLAVAALSLGAGSLPSEPAIAAPPALAAAIADGQRAAAGESGGSFAVTGDDPGWFCGSCHGESPIEHADPTRRHYVHGGFEILAFAFDFVGVSIIFFGTALALIKAAPRFLRHRAIEPSLSLTISRRVLIGLDILIAAELVGTVFVFFVPLEPDVLWHRAGLLVLTVVVRLALGYFFLKRQREYRLW